MSRQPPANPALRRLLGAWLQSCLGTGAGYVALLLLVVRHLPHSAWAVTAVLLADFLPAIALGTMFGALADRYSRRLLIVAANVLQAGAFAGLAFAAGTGPILVLAALAGVGNALQRPAMRSLLPVVAGPRRQQAAAWFDSCRWIGLSAGPLLAAVLFAVSGIAAAFAVNAASFLLSAVVIATLTIVAEDREDAAPPEPAAPGVRAGIAIAMASPGVAAVIACSTAAIVAGGLLNVCEPLFALRVLHGSGSQYAVLVAAYGAGMVAASLLVARRGEAGEGEIIRRYLLSLALIALGLAGTAIVGSIWLALITFAATGYANALMVVSETQLIQARVPNAVQGRLYGMRDAVEGVSFLTGLVGAGALIGAAGVRVTLGTAAALCAACAVAALVALGSSALQSRRGIIARDLGIASDGAAAATSPRRFDPDAAEPVRASRGTPAAPPAVNQSPAGQRGARQPPPWTA
ncbi:MAG TPA: MFS transporter [Solirubrobacteraceae bacterium]|nr:MFS transporter [Solirubrobacteraceae bacterium]